MGALSFWGGLAGAGKGIADIGSQMAMAEERRARDEREAQMREQLQRERLDAQREAAATRGTSGGRSGGMSLADLAKDPALLSLSSGMSRAEVDDALALSRGQDPMVPVAEDDGSGFSATEMPKYTPGQASALRERMTQSLYQAMGLNNPGQSDDLAKAQRTAQGTKYAAEYRDTGSERAGSAALINDSKPANNDGTNVVSGKVTPGSLDAARIKTEGAKQGAEGALARQRGEDAKTTADKREGKGSIREEISVLQQRRKGSEELMKSAQRALSEAIKMGNDEDAADARATIKSSQASLAAIDKQLDSLTTRLQDKAGVKTPEAPKTAEAKAAEAKAIADAKAVLAKKPGARDEVIRRLKAAGYSTAGL